VAFRQRHQTREARGFTASLVQAGTQSSDGSQRPALQRRYLGMTGDNHEQNEMRQAS
jgi:hypothetical protein